MTMITLPTEEQDIVLDIAYDVIGFIDEPEFAKQLEDNLNERAQDGWDVIQPGNGLLFLAKLVNDNNYQVTEYKVIPFEDNAEAAPELSKCLQETQQDGYTLVTIFSSLILMMRQGENIKNIKEHNSKKYLCNTCVYASRLYTDKDTVICQALGEIEVPMREQCAFANLKRLEEKDSKNGKK